MDVLNVSTKFEKLLEEMLGSIPPEHLVMVSLDVEKAYNRVKLDLLINALRSSDLDPLAVEDYVAFINLCKLLRTEAGDVMDDRCFGLPQGAEPSTDLWNFWLAYIFSECSRTNSYNIFYADNGTFFGLRENITKVLNEVVLAWESVGLSPKYEDLRVFDMNGKDIDDPVPERILGLQILVGDTIEMNVPQIELSLRRVHVSSVDMPPYVGINFLKSKFISVSRFHFSAALTAGLLSVKLCRLLRQTTREKLQQATCVLNYSYLDMMRLGIDPLNFIYLKSLKHLEIPEDVWEYLLDPVPPDLKERFKNRSWEPQYLLTTHIGMKENLKLWNYFSLNVAFGKEIAENTKNYHVLKRWVHVVREYGLFPMSFSQFIDAIYNDRKRNYIHRQPFWIPETGLTDGPLSRLIRHNLRILDEIYIGIVQNRESQMLFLSDQKYFDRDGNSYDLFREKDDKKKKKKE